MTRTATSRLQCAALARCGAALARCGAALARCGAALAAGWAMAWPVAGEAASCADLGTALSPACRRIVDTYEQGRTGLLLSGYSWHLPSTWSSERRAELNANAWGGGLVRTTEDEKGDSRSVFLLAFRDSHENIQWNLGYEHSTYWGSRSGLQAGLGYTLMIVQRPDIADGVPFPAILPLASLRYRDGTFFMTYIPSLGGGINHGSTLFMFGRVLLR